MAPDNLVDDLVTRLVGELDALDPADHREAASITETIGCLRTLARPLDEEAGRVHVTASAILTGPAGVCLHRHKRMGIWLQPGGHVDPGEAPWDAALRETAEETGLAARFVHPVPDGTARVVHVDVHDAPRGHRHLDLRYLLAAEGTPDPGPAESPDVAWFSWDDALEVADDGLRAGLAVLRPGGERRRHLDSTGAG